MFIDSVKLFISSEVPSVTPILGRLYSGQPCLKSKEGMFCFERPTPFIIGFYHGRDKPPNVHSFLQAMLNEFDRLCPDINDVIPLRSCTASLRCDKIGFNMVTGFVIDSMHTMISGAFLRKLYGFASNPLEEKLGSTQLAQVEKRLKFYRHCRLYEFDRYVGSFSQCGKYKGHVLRQFL